MRSKWKPYLITLLSFSKIYLCCDGITLTFLDPRTILYGSLPCGTARYGRVWYGMVWYGMVWYGMVWYGMVWYGMVWYRVLFFVLFF